MKRAGTPRARTSRRVTGAASIDTLFPLPQHVLRIARADGATIVLSGPDTKAMREYHTRVQKWFDDADLAGPTSAEYQIDAFIAATTEPDLTPPSDCTIEVEPFVPAKQPPAIVGDTYSTTGLLTRRAASSYIMARSDERFETHTGVAIRHREGTIEAEVEMRGPNDETALIIPLAQRTPDHDAIRSAASQLGGLHEDVLDIALANAIRNGANAAGRFEIEVDSIVRVRGRGQKKKQEGAAIYNAGFVPEMRASVVHALDALARIWITQDLEPKLRRGRLTRAYDRIFKIERKHVDANTRELISIEYTLGSWFADFKEHVVLAPRALLALDARNGAPAKALGRYFILLSAGADGNGRLVRTVRDVIGTVRRSFTYGKNPQRLRSWLEDNLETLVDHAIIDAWEYDPAASVDALPYRNWIEDWLELRVAVQLPAARREGARR